MLGGGGAGGPEADDQLRRVSGGGRPSTLLHPRLLPVDADRGRAAVPDLRQGAGHIHFQVHPQDRAAGLG